jgi:hypothetical protein
MRRSLAFLLAVSLGTFATPARADEPQWVLSPGPFFVEHVMKKSAVDTDGVNVGGGFEVSLMRFGGPVYGNLAGYGLNAQFSILSLDGHAAYQGAISAQAGTFLGLEAGLYARSSAGRFGADGGLRLAPYASLAFGWISMGLEIPIVQGDGPQHVGVGASLICGLKWPAALSGGSLFPAAHERTEPPPRPRPAEPQADR